MSVRSFKLTNSLGKSVTFLSKTMFGYSPTGLGVEFENKFAQYETAFIQSASSVKQGNFSLEILFGDIQGHAYETFDEFSSFLAFQPYILEYTTPAGTWHRDAVLSKMGKTEMNTYGRIGESFSIDFLNTWYNNKTAQYKGYDIDSNLAIHGKGFFNEIGASNRNLILNSSGGNASDTVRPSISGGTNSISSATLSYSSDYVRLTLLGNNDYPAYNLLDYGTVLLDTPLSYDKTYTMSVDVRGEVPAAAVVASNGVGQLFAINKDTWTRITHTFKFVNNSASPGTIDLSIKPRTSATDGTDPTKFTKGQFVDMRHFKLEEGSVATPWSYAPEDGISNSNMKYVYGYWGQQSTDATNLPYTDSAQTDVTYLDN